MVNKATIIGYLGKDPELRHTQSGNSVCNFSVATTEKWRGQDGNMQEQTTWHNIVVWGKTAENCERYLAKGRLVYVEGRIQNRSYENKQGETRYISEIVAQRVQFLGGGGGDGERSQGGQQQQGGGNQPPVDDGIPF